jgi:dTDP-D-glucose 4,6-dehydratase
VPLYGVAFGIDSVILRYFRIFGPRQRLDMLFSRLISSALDRQPITIIGDGRQSRDFTYVADAVVATMAAADTGKPGHTYNIAGGCQATVLEVVALLETFIGRPLARDHVDPEAGDLRKTAADTSAAPRFWLLTSRLSRGWAHPPARARSIRTGLKRANALRVMWSREPCPGCSKQRVWRRATRSATHANRCDHGGGCQVTESEQEAENKSDC